MSAREIGRRTVAFFLLTSVANVVGVIVLGLALAAGLIAGARNLALTLLPACVAALGIVAALLAGRAAARMQRRVEERAPGARSRRARALLGTRRSVAEGVRARFALLRRLDPVLLSGVGA